MSFEFHLPDIGEGVIEGEIVAWKVQEGESIDLDQPMVEIMTDKATVEIPSPRAGRVVKINFREGEVCPVGDVLVVIETGGAVAEAPPPPAPVTHAPPQAATPHAATHAPATHAPPPHAATHAQAQAVAELARDVASDGAVPVVDASPERRRVLATPATRRLARELGVDLAVVPGTGRNGRVSTEDVRRFSDGAPAAVMHAAAVHAKVPGPRRMPKDTLTSPPPPAATAPPQALTYSPPPAVVQVRPASGSPELEERVPFRGMRKRIAENMALSMFTATHFTYVEEIDVTELVELRTRGKARAAERGIQLSFLPFIIKAVVAGLKKWPQLNASLDEAAQEIVRKKYYHIGIAAQGPQGLMVSVVRDADRRSIFELATEIQRLSVAVQNGTAKREELTGSTFTITSLGKLGGVMATPIINFPEVGILGVHKIAERPAVVDGAIAIRSLMNLSISLDHRLVDGWDGAMFLQDVKTLLEDPTLMFMELS